MSTAAIVKTLNRADMDAEAYTRGPIGQDTFIVGVQNRLERPAGTLKLWTGLADVDVHTNKRRRQAVLNVDEPRRTVSRWLSVGGYGRSDAEAIARREFPVEMPSGTTFVAVETHLDPRYNQHLPGLPPPTSGWRHWRVRVEATAKATKQDLLVGIDEVHHFVALLPERVTSVADAHDILRPASVPERSPRQGEWFFVPVSSRLAARLNRRWDEERYRQLKSEPLESGSAHIARQLLFHDRFKYARGHIIDTRKVRHKPLELPDWHRVVRNRERHARPSIARRSRYWD